jgi:hypothetical protein
MCLILTRGAERADTALLVAEKSAHSVVVALPVQLPQADSHRPISTEVSEGQPLRPRVGWRTETSFSERASQL